MNRLLAEVRASYLRDEQGEKTDFRARYGEAVESLRTNELREVELAIGDTARRMLGFKGTAAAGRL